MTVTLHPEVRIRGSIFYLCGRLMTKRHFDPGIEGAPEWTLSGAVYTTRNPIVTLHDVVFIPWVLPIPSLRADGTSDIELVAQVAKDVADAMVSVLPDVAYPRYLGEIRYSVIVQRKTECHARHVHIGEILKTDDPRTFVIRLHALPFLVAEPCGEGVITPIMAFVGEIPRKMFATAKYRAKVEKKRKEAQDGSIIHAGSRYKRGVRE
jgi:hypothetical protein